MLCSSLAARAVEPGDLLPPLAFPSLEADADLDPTSLDGQLVYVDFWASWCPPCLNSLPALNRIYADYRDRGFKVLAINLDEDPADAVRFLARHAVDYTVLSDPAGDSARIFALPGMPTSYLVDREGRVIWRHVGFRKKDEAKIRERIEAAL